MDKSEETHEINKIHRRLDRVEELIAKIMDYKLVTRKAMEHLDKTIDTFIEQESKNLEEGIKRSKRVFDVRGTEILPISFNKEDWNKNNE